MEGCVVSVLFELITQPLRLFHVDLNRQIKVRYRGFTLDRRPGDGFPHLA